MQQFTIPQFLEVEDKIIGPVTVRQFIILIIAGLFIFIAYKLLAFGWFIAAAVGLGVTASVLAFVKINGRPFHFFMLNFIQTSYRPKIRVWLKDITTEELRILILKKPEITPAEHIPLKRALEASSLSEVSLIVDTGGAFKGEETYG